MTEFELRVIEETKTCRHFIAPFHNPCCKAGVNYRELVGGPVGVRDSCLVAS